MSRSIAERAARDAEEIIEDAARQAKRAARRLSEDAGDTLSAGAIGLAHAAEDFAETAQSKSRRLATRVGEEIKARPATFAALGAALVAFIGFGLARRPRRR